MRQYNRFELFVISLLICIFLQSCRDKEVLTSVQGEIRDYYTELPMINFKLVLIKKTNRFPYIIEDVVDSLKTNSEGKFSYLLEADTKFSCSYILKAIDDKYENFDEHINIYNSSNEFNKKLKPFKVVSLEIIKKTEDYKYICLFRRPREIFKDTIIILNEIIPDELFELEIAFYKSTGSDRIIEDESIYINNIDTTFLYREY